jgi:hypothetical protein
MRTLEILTLIALVPLIIGLAFQPMRHRIWLRVLAWTALALTVLQLVVEGYRWQMIPAYLLAVSGCLRTRKAAGHATRDSRRRKLVRLAGGLDRFSGNGKDSERLYAGILREVSRREAVTVARGPASCRPVL